MSAQIIPFPGVNVDATIEPVSFDEARPGWEQQIADAAASIEHVERQEDWVVEVRDLANLLTDLLASITVEP